MPDRLLLWDVDGTLIRGGAIAGDAFAIAVERALGRHPGEHGVQMGGKTDPQIAREILTIAGVADAEIEGQVATVISHLEEELGAAEELLRSDGRVLPGVLELLPRLKAAPGVIQSLLTGNTAANAAVKLAAFGLGRWIDVDVAAFGSDDADRLRLVPVAVERARRLRGFEPEPGTVWVIGDTRHDVACARAADARCLLVATGRTPYEELASLDADAVMHDLSDVDHVADLLLS